jgi:hypothetical protein
LRSEVLPKGSHVRKILVCSLFACLAVPFGCGGGNASGHAFSSNFVAGIAHVAGNYGFTQDNFLMEGAQKISSLGSESIFVYLTPWFRSQDPDQSANQWPSADPPDLAHLAETAPYGNVFNMNFQTIVLTTYTFANADGVIGMASSPDRLQAEETEFYQLTKYLYSQFTGSGKTFILKNWEGDWVGLGEGNTTGNIPDSTVQDMIAWLTARQKGVTRARNEANDTSMQVSNAVEVNRVLDYAQQGLTRVVNAVVPNVGADMVTYSSYDSTAIGSDAATVNQNLTLALNSINKLAPDPLGLGMKRILISEYGLYENQLTGDATWRSKAILSTAKNAGIAGAFLWNLYDNECVEPDGQPAPVDVNPGNPARPGDSSCRGLWVVRPDGSDSSVVSVLKQYW